MRAVRSTPAQVSCWCSLIGWPSLLGGVGPKAGGCSTHVWEREEHSLCLPFKVLYVGGDTPETWPSFCGAAVLGALLAWVDISLEQLEQTTLGCSPLG